MQTHQTWGFVRMAEGCITLFCLSSSLCQLVRWCKMPFALPKIPVVPHKSFLVLALTQLCTRVFVSFH